MSLNWSAAADPKGDAASTDDHSPLLGSFLGLRQGCVALPALLDQVEGSVGERRQKHVLEAFLVAAAVDQIVDETLHRDAPFVDRAARAAPRLLPPRAAPTLGWLAGVLAEGLVSSRGRGRRERALMGWKRSLDALVDRLADDLTPTGVGVRSAPPGEMRLAAQIRALVGAVSDLPPQVLRTVVRPPTCFSRVDQRPGDMFRVARDVATRWPDRRRSVLVVGLRTSGSYLAPLYCAGLRCLGYSDVNWVAIRPNERRLPDERRLFKQAVDRSGLVLLADDPPRTGGQLDLVARELITAGVPPQDVVLLLTLLGPETTVPPRLERYERIVLPWRDWDIHSRADVDVVRAELTHLLTGRRITIQTKDGAETVAAGAVRDVACVSSSTAGCSSHERDHVRYRFRITFVEQGCAVEREHDAVVEGIGLGHFSSPWEHARERLSSFFVDIYGVNDGLLYRSSVPDAWLLTEHDYGTNALELAKRVASYVARREDETRVATDPTVHARDGRAVWERCSRMLLTAFGGPYLRPFTDQVAKRLLHVTDPSVPDPQIDASSWARFPGAIEPTLRKTKLGLDYSSDAVASLARSSADSYQRLGEHEGEAFAAELKRSYESLSSRPIGEERWLLYQLLYQWEHLAGVTSAEAALRGSATIESLLRNYLAGIYLSDLPIPDQGELCAIDLDGVLESRWLSAPSTTPLGALALRTLSRHGYRAVLASGRSVAELQERCRAYRLAGGVAEYGAAIYLQESGNVVSTLSEAEMQAIADVREAVSAAPGVYVDPRYEFSVRAYQVHAGRELTGLGSEQIHGILRAGGWAETIRAVQGGGQTDFVPASVSKASGVLALARALARHGQDPPRVALAVGNSTPDFSMCRIARSGWLTANTSRHVREAAAAAPIPFLSHPFQAGVLEAVEDLVGHRTMRCGRCAFSPLPPDTDLLLMVLALRSTRRQTKLAQIMRFAAADIGRRVRASGNSGSRAGEHARR